MLFLSRLRSFLFLILTFGLMAVFPTNGRSHDGDNPGAIIGDNGWKTFELITENDSLTNLVLGQSYSPGEHFVIRNVFLEHRDTQ